jgi:hypothetical protein
MLAVTLVPKHISQLVERWPSWASVVIVPHGVSMIDLPVLILSGLVSAAILAWFHRLPYQATKEEELSDARALQSQQLLGTSGVIE